MDYTELMELKIPPEQKISRMLRQVERERRSYMDANLRDFGLQGDMYLFLLTLNRCPGASQDYVADQLRLDKSNTARVALKLEKAGFIARTPVPGNRRQYQITLTDRGHEAVDEIRRILRSWQKAALKNFSPEEESLLIEFLFRMMQSSRETE